MATLTQAMMAIIFTCAVTLMLAGLFYTMSGDSTKYDISPYFGAYSTDNSTLAMSVADPYADYSVNTSSSAVPILSMAFVSNGIQNALLNFQSSFQQNTGNVVTDTLSKLSAGFGLMVFLTVGIAIATLVTLFQSVNLISALLNIFSSLPPPFNVISGAVVGGSIGLGAVLIVAVTLNLAMKIYRSVKTGDNI